MKAPENARPPTPEDPDRPKPSYSRAPASATRTFVAQPESLNAGFGLQSIPERRMTTQLSSAAAPAEPELKSFVKRGDRKFTISHNNRVQPNFNSQTYQEEARASFKKRMAYNPMEAAKKRHNPRELNITSEYSQANVMRGATQ